MISQSYNDGLIVDHLSHIIRPVIGLTTPQVKANLNYWKSAWQSGVDSGLSSKSAVKRADQMSAAYAGRQHRYRAMCIAQTELANAYNHGAHIATIKAQEDGYLGDCVKVWLTADNERVCPTCGLADGEKRKLNELFSTGVLVPTAHPSCHCAVAYEEVTE